MNHAQRTMAIRAAQAASRGRQGFVTDEGLVGWWRPENDAQTVKAQRDELLEALKVRHLELRYCNQQLRIEGYQKNSGVESALVAGEAAISKAEGKEGGAA